jgi:hypothetical protein
MVARSSDDNAGGVVGGGDDGHANTGSIGVGEGSAQGSAQGSERGGAQMEEGGSGERKEVDDINSTFQQNDVLNVGKKKGKKGKRAGKDRGEIVATQSQSLSQYESNESSHGLQPASGVLAGVGGKRDEEGSSNSTGDDHTFSHTRSDGLSPYARLATRGRQDTEIELHGKLEVEVEVGGQAVVNSDVDGDDGYSYSDVDYSDGSSRRELIGFVTSGRDVGSDLGTPSFGLCNVSQLLQMQRRAGMFILSTATATTTATATATTVMNKGKEQEQQMNRSGARDDGREQSGNVEVEVGIVGQLLERKMKCIAVGDCSGGLFRLVMFRNPSSQWLRPAIVQIVSTVEG